MSSFVELGWDGWKGGREGDRRGLSGEESELTPSSDSRARRRELVPRSLVPTFES